MVRSRLLFVSLSFRRRYPTCAASGNAVHYIPGVLSCLPVLFAAVAVARGGALLRTFEKTSLPRFFILDRGSAVVGRVADTPRATRSRGRKGGLFLADNLPCDCVSYALKAPWTSARRRRRRRRKSVAKTRAQLQLRTRTGNLRPTRGGVGVFPARHVERPRARGARSNSTQRAACVCTHCTHKLTRPYYVDDSS